MKVFTDQLQHEVKEMRESGLPMGMLDITPVDVFGGFVAVDKYAPDNLRRTQDNIEWKTALRRTNDWESEVRHK